MEREYKRRSGREKEMEGDSCKGTRGNGRGRKNMKERKKGNGWGR